jgi:alginate O-acetyltransferase complex protein AlgI
MLFTSPLFLFAFLPAVLAVYFAVPRRLRGVRNAWLLAASLVFYGTGEPGFVAVLAGSCLVNWAAGLLVRPGRRGRNAALWVAVAANLALLFRWKYLAFAVRQLNLLPRVDLPVPEIALPLGISFFTFQAMSYVIDVWRGVSPPRRNPLDVALYVTLFPQLVAGPIVRYETVAGEIRGRRESWSDFSSGACRFVEGFAKKMLLANPLAVVADSAFDGADWIPAVAGGGPVSASMAWLGAAAFALQIYFDFSGYSDMAIGMGRMFGFHFLENFLHPYASRSVSEFWRRWHVSMGTWFRDYVYFPLGGSRVKTRSRLLFNLLAVWFLTGLWHGADWTFVCWGLMYFALIAAEKLLGFRPEGHSALRETLGRLYAGFFVLCGWVLFRADSVPAAFRYLGAMFGRGVPSLCDSASLLLLRENAVVFAAALLLCLPVAPALERLADRVCATPVRSAARAVLRAAWLSLLFAASISFVAKGAHNPFLYFNF